MHSKSAELILLTWHAMIQTLLINTLWNVYFSLRLSSNIDEIILKMFHRKISKIRTPTGFISIECKSKRFILIAFSRCQTSLLGKEVRVNRQYFLCLALAASGYLEGAG